jgi:hypothetical protein
MKGQILSILALTVAAAGEQVLSEAHLRELRTCLEIIHEEFGRLYDVGSDDDFAMEVEYKITSEDKLAIKQTRPWVH